MTVQNTPMIPRLSILFESVKKYLREHLKESKTLAIRKWKLEVKTLKKEKQNLYNQILEMREDIDKLFLLGI